MLTNPVVLSVIVMTILCLLKLNVILSLVVAAIIGGFVAGMSLGDTMGVLVGGMGGNAETALSYILLGALATAIAKTGAADILALKIAKLIKGKGIVLLLVIAFVACLSGTVIPVHIAFIPILIPPLLAIMNKMKMDRRAAACALAFGLKAPYITLPVGYGLIYHNIIRDQMGLSGMEISTGMVWRANWVAGLAMLTGLVIALIVYSKPREYNMLDKAIDETAASLDNQEEIKVTGKHYATLVAGVAALVIQLKWGSMPLGAMGGLLVMLISRAIKWNDIEEMMHGGIKLMGLIAFVMLVASGYAAVMRETGGVEALVEAATSMMAGSKFIAATIMILLGLVITMGIGTSFGTVPIIAAIYCPLASALGFSVKATILLIAVAAALGDAGSPASDTTLGPTAGLNADGQHDHIWDTCVPTFLCYNVPLVIFGIIGAVIF
ncbi:TRAP transporter large permease subunit [Crassaminicella thermophila]|uniref:TRAP transporter large permease subunit n=1 Tax=Crassaminicella thermophila TaxID=2599308 RepID=A0A5C0S8S5_CRATE|nr:SLC13 family permease [Crassaminicella thermophila]QEK11065.1 TRAP transporter large permease subunit [Crassaminicella thermophila]